MKEWREDGQRARQRAQRARKTDEEGRMAGLRESREFLDRLLLRAAEDPQDAAQTALEHVSAPWASEEDKQLAPRLSELRDRAWGDPRAVVDFLVEVGASPSAKDEGGNTALTLAVRAGREETLGALLGACDPNEPGPGGATPLAAAAEQGRLECLRRLLADPRCDARAKDEEGRDALMWAARHGHAACIDALISVSDPTAADGRGKTALMHAAWKGEEESVALLLPVSDPTAVDDQGYTALMEAIHNGDLATLRRLLETSDPNTQDNSGHTALNIATDLPDRVAAVAILLPVSDLSVRNKRGRTPLETAVKWENWESADLFTGHASVAELAEAVKDAPKDKMPAARAAIERAALADALAERGEEASLQTGGIAASTENGAQTERAATGRRL
jgi:ankyrin repeat protein